MKLIAGLGNPGQRYKNTRHNIGFLVLDKLANKFNAKLKRKLFKKTKQVNLSLFGEDILLIEPLTFMNLSGSCVLHFYNKLRFDLEDMLIVCDDVNLPLEKIRLRSSGSAGGHNGLSSIIESLGSEQFSRLRVGIKGPDAIEDLSEYVLSDFAYTEKDTLNDVINNAVIACESWIKDGTETTMNKFN